jgi:5-methylcytosine-specific restriction endonuclease McrA
MTSADYRIYLRSPEWRAKKTEVFRRAGYMCEYCESNPAVQVHHLRYPARWGDESLDDLQAVCRECHKEHHGL